MKPYLIGGYYSIITIDKIRFHLTTVTFSLQIRLTRFRNVSNFSILLATLSSLLYKFTAILLAGSGIRPVATKIFIDVVEELASFLLTLMVDSHNV